MRIPHMRGFVEAAHDLGMDFLLWYSVPFIGEAADNYPRFVVPAAGLVSLRMGNGGR